MEMFCITVQAQDVANSVNDRGNEAMFNGMILRASGLAARMDLNHDCSFDNDLLIVKPRKGFHVGIERGPLFIVRV